MNLLRGYSRAGAPLGVYIIFPVLTARVYRLRKLLYNNPPSARKGRVNFLRNSSLVQSYNLQPVTVAIHGLRSLTLVAHRAAISSTTSYSLFDVRLGASSTSELRQGHPDCGLAGC
eukprot:2029413-Pyramimonas_sp.AAC.1